MSKVIDQAIELKEQAVQTITTALQQLHVELQNLKVLEKELLIKYNEVPSSIENFANYRVFKSSILSRLEEVASKCIQLEEKVSTTKARLVAANIEKEKFVRFKAKQIAKKQAVEDKRQQKQFDEFASNAYVRKQKENDSN